MAAPANLSPVSLADIGAMLDAKVDKILSRQNEEAAKRDTEAAKRDAARDVAAAKRDAALRAEMSNLRGDIEKRDIEAAKRDAERDAEAAKRDAERDIEAAERDAEAAKREKRLTTITLVAIGAMAAILGYLQKDDDAPAPPANPPQVIYITPPAMPPVVEPR